MGIGIIRWGQRFKSRMIFSIAVICCLSTITLIIYTGILENQKRTTLQGAWNTIWKQSRTLIGDQESIIDWNSSPYLIDTPTCRLPSLSPFDPSIKEFVRFHRPHDCSDIAPLTFTDGPYIRINQQEFSNWKNRKSSMCFATPILRSDIDDRTLISLPPSPLTLSTPYLMETDFARVHCYDRNNRTLYEEFHFNIENVVPLPLNESVPRPVSILLLGVDSISRLNMERQMKRTMAFFRSLPGHVQMFGYNKLGENTFPNVVPLLTGRLLKEQPCFYRKDFFDECPLIWKAFRERGYATLFAEDRFRIATFNFEKPGFRLPPTQYYLRPLMLAVEGSLTARARLATTECIGRRTETEIVLDYTMAFVEKHVAAKRPFFAYSFITGRSHGDLNNIGSVDHQYEFFFRRLNTLGVLERTLVVFFSDHGLRFGRFRQTAHGRHEARLPFISVLLPKSLSDEHPDMLRRLRTNAHRLSVPMDVHATIRNLASIPMPIKSDTRRGGLTPVSYSLLSEEIPFNRTCTDAGIVPMWCTCRITEHYLSPSSKKALLSGRAIINHINKIISKNFSDICAPLRLDRVLSAVTLLKENDRDETQILSTISASPSQAVYEAVTVLQKGPGNIPRARVLDGISRINSYGRQSHCMHSANLKNFCFCYDQ